MFRIGSVRFIQHGPRAVAMPKRPLSTIGRLRHSMITGTPVGQGAPRASNSTIVPNTTPTKFCIISCSRSLATKAPSGLQKGIDPEEDKKIAQRKLPSNPEAVSTESTVRHFYEPSEGGNERPVKEGVKEELKVVKETFSLANVPKEPYWLGLAGTLPYLGTSVSTVYLAWVLNTEWPSSSSFLNHIMISHDTASHLLATLEPIQLGYGAVIISFLGAIHWGLEYAEKVPNQARTRFRYGMGVVAPILAWPTLFMPVELALTSQFGAFVLLYFADARATVHGWAPAWYSTYRFALTAVVGVALAISLIGRAKVGDASPRLTGLSEKFHQTHGEEPYTKKWELRERKEKDKIEKERKEAERKKAEEEEQAQAEAEAEAEKQQKQQKPSKSSKKKAEDGENNKK